MMRCRYSTRSSEVFVVGHSQGTIMSLAALTQPDIAEEVVEAAALFCPIAYFEHITSKFVIFCTLYAQRMGRQPFGFDMYGYVDCLEGLYMILLLIFGVSVQCPPCCMFVFFQVI